MPVMDGLTATRMIKALFPRCEPVAPPLIIALTANAFAEDRQRCLEAGMDDYLAKPYDKSSLSALLEHHFTPAQQAHRSLAPVQPAA